MPRKRKKDESVITVRPASTKELKEAKKTKPSEIEIRSGIKIRCVWDSRLIVGPHITATGRKYEFTTGQIKPVDFEDYPILLAMETKPFGCCGGTIRPQKYFEEV